MKKSVATIESLDSKIDRMDQKFDAKFDLFIQTLGNFKKTIDQRFDKVDRRFDLLEEKVIQNTSSIDDIIENTQYILGSAITRDDVRQIVKDTIEPVEFRLLSAMDVIIGKHLTFEGEVLAVHYNNKELNRRVGIIEQTIGLPNAA